MKRILIVTASFCCGIIFAYMFANMRKFNKSEQSPIQSDKPTRHTWTKPQVMRKFDQGSHTQSVVAYITKDTIEKEVYQSNLPVVLDVYSTVCGPCQKLAPVIEELAHEYQGTFKFCKLNIDKNFNLANQYKIRSLPTLLFIKNNEIKGRAGFLKKEEIKEKINTFFFETNNQPKKEEEGIN